MFIWMRTWWSFLDLSCVAQRAMVKVLFFLSSLDSVDIKTITCQTCQDANCSIGVWFPFMSRWSGSRIAYSPVSCVCYLQEQKLLIAFVVFWVRRVRGIRHGRWTIRVSWLDDCRLMNKRSSTWWPLQAPRCSHFLSVQSSPLSWASPWSRKCSLTGNAHEIVLLWNYTLVFFHSDSKILEFLWVLFEVLSRTCILLHFCWVLGSELLEFIKTL